MKSGLERNSLKMCVKILVLFKKILTVMMIISQYVVTPYQQILYKFVPSAYEKWIIEKLELRLEKQNPIYINIFKIDLTALGF